MKLSDFTTSNSGAILAVGPPGSGKTTFCCQLPKPWLLETDNNIKGPVGYLRANNLPLDGTVIVPHIDDDSKTVPRHQRWSKLCDDGNKALNSPECQSIIVDSLTTVVDYCLDEVRRQQGRKIAGVGGATQDDPLQIQDWGMFAGLLKHFIVTLKASGKLVVFCAHVELIEDELVSKYLRHFIACPGQLRHTIAGYFDEVWLFGVEEQRQKDGTSKRVHTIRTAPDARMASLGLKSAIGLPPSGELKTSEILTQLAK